MKKVTVILFSALMVLIMSCEKEQVLLSQEEGTPAVEARKDSKSVHRPTWPAVVNSINEYINLLRREESLETRDAITLQRKIRNITYVIQEGRIAKAKKMIRVFQSDVTRMMEIGTFPPVEASNLLLMSKQLYRRL